MIFFFNSFCFLPSVRNCTVPGFNGRFCLLSEWEEPCSVEEGPWVNVGTESMLTVFFRLTALTFDLLLKRWKKESVASLVY